MYYRDQQLRNLSSHHGKTELDYKYLRKRFNIVCNAENERTWRNNLFHNAGLPGKVDFD